MSSWLDNRRVSDSFSLWPRRSFGSDGKNLCTVIYFLDTPRVRDLPLTWSARNNTGFRRHGSYEGVTSCDMSKMQTRLLGKIQNRNPVETVKHTLPRRMRWIVCVVRWSVDCRYNSSQNIKKQSKSSCAQVHVIHLRLLTIDRFSAWSKLQSVQ